MSTKRIRKGDTVVAVSGASSGRTGKVLQVLPSRERAIVEGLNLVKKTLRKTQDTPQGGMTEKEASIALSNLMLHCPDCKKGVRLNSTKEGDRRVRKCSRCGHGFDD